MLLLLKCLVGLFDLGLILYANNMPTAEDNGYDSFNIKLNQLNHWKALNTCSYMQSSPKEK